MVRRVFPRRVEWGRDRIPHFATRVREDIMQRTLCILLLLSASSSFRTGQKSGDVGGEGNSAAPAEEPGGGGGRNARRQIRLQAHRTADDVWTSRPAHHRIEQLTCARRSETCPRSKRRPLKESDGKDKLVEGLKASFDFCTTALAKVDDSKLGDEVELFGGHKGPRAFALIALTNDWADHYSSAAMYLRLNGMLPPTAQPKK